METVIIKVAESTIDQLNWLVARQERHNPTVVGGRVLRMPQSKFHTPRWLDYSTDWAQGGPIIEREGINLGTQRNEPGCKPHIDYLWHAQLDQRVYVGYGPTPLIAAMRCYCRSKLGDVTDIPEELCQ